MKSDRLKNIKTYKIGDMVCIPKDDYFIQRINGIEVDDFSDNVFYRVANKWYKSIDCKLVDEEKYEKLLGKIESEYIFKRR